MPVNLPYRQVHLDFHTSPHIQGVGSQFDPDEFADILSRSHVNSVTCFARCHHGMLYYPSQVNPERIHPGLVRKDLLPAQIEACHRRGIRAPIYTTVQWDDFTADEHREWLSVDAEGRLYDTRPLDPGFYRVLDVFHPGYRQFLRDHVAELFRTMPVDGLFFDIVMVRPSLARHWLDAMEAEGVDPEDGVQRHRFAQRVMDDWKRETSEFIRSQPGYTGACTIFYNSGHVGPATRPSSAAYTHFELESLPSGGWGYLHFPVAQHYVRNLGKPTLGMTGKFHTSWGDFHSYKNPAALQFECFHMLALGAACSVGDQLHPAGRLDPYTYDLVRPVFQRAEQVEPWCRDAQPVCDMAVLTPEEFPQADGAQQHDNLPAAVLGAVRMLQEMHAQFDIIPSDKDFSAYRLLILPDAIPLHPALAARLEAYLDRGGAVIASHCSGLAPDGAKFATEYLGVSLCGAAPFSPDFLVPGPRLRELSGLNPTSYTMYERGLEVSALEGSEVLAEVETPYFNRTWRHFCSHRHAPSTGLTGYPGIVRRDNAIYFSHPIFATYQTNAPLWCRKLLEAAVRILLPAPAVSIEAPSSTIVALTRQAAERRLVLHVMHYVPERRGTAFDVLEDILPVYDVPVTVRSTAPVTAIRYVPGGNELPFAQQDGLVQFILPRVKGYEVIELCEE